MAMKWRCESIGLHELLCPCCDEVVGTVEWVNESDMYLAQLDQPKKQYRVAVLKDLGEAKRALEAAFAEAVGAKE